MSRVQFTPLIGLPQFNGWSQAVINDHQNLMVVFSVSGQNAGNIGRDIVTQTQNADLDSVEKFYDWLETLIIETEQLGVELDITAAWLTETKIAYAVKGGSVILKRGEKVGIALNSAKLQLIIGPFTLDDVIVFITRQAQSYAGEIEQKLIQGYSPDVIVKSLETGVHKMADSATIGLGFVSFSHHVADEDVEAEAISPLASLVPLELPPTAESVPPIMTESAQEKSSQAAAFEPLLASADANTRTEAPTTKLDTKQLLVKTGAGLGAVWQTVKPLIASASRLVFRATRRVARNLVPLLKRAKTKGLPSLVAAVQEDSTTNDYLASDRRAKFIKIAVAILVVVALIIGGLSWWRGRQAAELTKANQAVAPLVTQFQAAVDQVATDPISGRQAMQNTIAQMEQLAKEAPANSITQKTIQVHLQQAQDQFAQLSGQEQTQSLAIFADLRAQQSDFIATQVLSNGQQALFIDAEKKTGLVMSLSDKSVRAISLADLTTFSPSTWYKDSLYLISGGIQLTDVSGTTASLKPLVPDGESNKTATKIAGYGDYIYVLNPTKHNIYRYLRGPKDVSDPIGWMKPGQPLPYEQITDVQVDGDMWLSTDDGKILKLTSGEAQSFEIKGMDKPFTSRILMTSSEDDQQLYILEPSAKRLAIIGKNGNFVKQVESPSLAAATDLMVTADKTKVLIVSGSLVFEVATL